MKQIIKRITKKSIHFYQEFVSVVWDFLHFYMYLVLTLIYYFFTILSVSMLILLLGEDDLSDFRDGLLVVLIVINGIHGIVLFIKYLLIQQSRERLKELITLRNISLSEENKKANIFKGTTKNRLFELKLVVDRKEKYGMWGVTFMLISKSKNHKPFLLYKKAAFAKLKYRLNLTPKIDIDDPFFSNRFIIESDDTAFVKFLFTKELKQDFVIIYPQFKGKLQIEAGKITYQQFGLLYRKKRIEQLYEMMNLVEKIANKLEGVEE